MSSFTHAALRVGLASVAIAMSVGCGKAPAPVGGNSILSSASAEEVVGANVHPAEDSDETHAGHNHSDRGESAHEHAGHAHNAHSGSNHSHSDDAQETSQNATDNIEETAGVGGRNPRKRMLDDAFGRTQASPLNPDRSHDHDDHAGHNHGQAEGSEHAGHDHGANGSAGEASIGITNGKGDTRSDSRPWHASDEAPLSRARMPYDHSEHDHGQCDHDHAHAGGASSAPQDLDQSNRMHDNHWHAETPDSRSAGAGSAVDLKGFQSESSQLEHAAHRHSIQSDSELEIPHYDVREMRSMTSRRFRGQYHCSYRDRGSKGEFEVCPNARFDSCPFDHDSWDAESNDLEMGDYRGGEETYEDRIPEGDAGHHVH